MIISIIIPIYNVEKYIFDCLQSVATQTMTKEVECILVDDCGKDDSMQIAQSFVKNYKGEITFHILHHTVNRGLSAARNTGIHHAEGDYIYFLDSDDTITPECIESLYNLATRHNADMVQGSYISESNFLNKFAHKLPCCIDDNRTIKRLMLNYDRFPVMAQNRLIKRELVIKNNIFFKEGIIHEDNHWTFFLAKHITKLAICDYPTYHYQITPNSITSHINKEKETHAYTEIIKDFCNNIDSTEKGAQKCIIMLLLLIVRNQHYYKSETEFRQIKEFFYQHNSIAEIVILKIIFKTNTNNWIYKKAVNIIQRIYSI